MESEKCPYDTMMQADGFDLAIIGIAERIGMKPCLAYSYEQCVEILKQETKMSEEEAIEYMEFNVCGAYVGEQTPIFVREVEAYDA